MLESLNNLQMYERDWTKLVGHLLPPLGSSDLTFDSDTAVVRG